MGLKEGMDLIKDINNTMHEFGFKNDNISLKNDYIHIEVDKITIKLPFVVTVVLKRSDIERNGLDQAVHDELEKLHKKINGVTNAKSEDSK